MARAKVRVRVDGEGQVTVGAVCVGTGRTIQVEDNLVDCKVVRRDHSCCVIEVAGRIIQVAREDVRLPRILPQVPLTQTDLMPWLLEG